MEGMKVVRVFFLIVFAGWMAAGCAHVYTAHGAYYRVKEGDTLEEVAKRYKADVQDLAEVNNIESSSDLRPGSSLYIPGLTPNRLASLLKKEGVAVHKAEKKEKSKEEKTDQKKEKQKKSKNEEGSEEEVASTREEKGVKTERGRFIWPIEGDISSLFGMRHGRKHDGLDISAKTGTPVYAAADGEVVYAKKMRGYGNLVLLKHKDDFFSVYAHNSVNLVKVGAKVKKGQLVSRVGRTGRATGPHLHFEIREGPKARNPLFFLPKNMYAEKAKDLKDDAGAELEGEDPEGENPPEEAAPEETLAAPEVPKAAVKETAKQSPKPAPKKTTKAAAKPAAKLTTKPKTTPKKAVKTAPKKTTKTAPKAKTKAVKPQGAKNGKTEAKNP